MHHAPANCSTLTPYPWMEDRLNKVRERGLLRTLGTPRAPQEGALHFSSNDYLGLSNHPALYEGARAAMECWGVGSQASRLAGGNLALHERLESKIALAKGTECALLGGSGFHTNSQVLPTLLGHIPSPRQRATGHLRPVVLCDRLAHASLYQGLALADADVVRIHHNDLNHLETCLKRYAIPGQAVWIVTESVFSMDGDRCPLPEILALKHQYGAYLYLDEAHATGVLGHNGYGLASDYPGHVDVIMGTFSKALGGYGSCIASSRLVRDFLINFCPGMIFTTALPPAVVGAAEAAWDLLPLLEPVRQGLLSTSKALKDSLERLRPGATLASTTPILPYVVGCAQNAMKLSENLAEHGIIARAMRPPTVPPGTCRLRLAITAKHTSGDINRLIQALEQHDTTR